MIMKTTDAVVARPTPSAPPRVSKPMWTEMSGITKPNTTPLAIEYMRSQLCQKSRAPYRNDSCPRPIVNLAATIPAPTPTRSARPTSSGIARVHAIRRGAAITATGSRPSEYRASICSETFMVPSSAVIRAPTRPITTKAVITGPSSSTTLEVTTLPST